MDAPGGGFGFKKLFESKMAASVISILKTMNTITIRPLLTIKLATFGALVLLLLIQSL